MDVYSERVEAECSTFSLLDDTFNLLLAPSAATYPPTEPNQASSPLPHTSPIASISPKGSLLAYMSPPTVSAAREPPWAARSASGAAWDVAQEEAQWQRPDGPRLLTSQAPRGGPPSMPPPRGHPLDRDRMYGAAVAPSASHTRDHGYSVSAIDESCTMEGATISVIDYADTLCADAGDQMWARPLPTHTAPPLPTATPASPPLSMGSAPKVLFPRGSSSDIDDDSIESVKISSALCDRGAQVSGQVTSSGFAAPPNMTPLGPKEIVPLMAASSVSTAPASTHRRSIPKALSPPTAKQSIAHSGPVRPAAPMPSAESDPDGKGSHAGLGAESLSPVRSTAEEDEPEAYQATPHLSPPPLASQSRPHSTPLAPPPVHRTPTSAPVGRASKGAPSLPAVALQRPQCVAAPPSFGAAGRSPRANIAPTRPAIPVASAVEVVCPDPQSPSALTDAQRMEEIRSLLAHTSQLTAQAQGHMGHLADSLAGAWVSARQSREGGERKPHGSDPRGPPSSQAAGCAAALRAQLQALRAGLAEEKVLVRDQCRDGCRDLQRFAGSLLAEFVATQSSDGLSRDAAAAASLQAEVTRLRTLCQGEARERVRLHNQLQEIRGNVRVLVRVRPLLSGEQTPMAGSPRRLSWQPSDHPNSLAEFPSANQLRFTSLQGSLQGGVKSPKTHQYTFDRVLDPQSTQEDCMRELEPLAVSVMDGYSGCVMAYGQTGSGKTHTMFGSEGDRGLMFRVLQYLWDRKTQREADGHAIYSVTLSVMEIYNEALYDLLLGDGTIRDKRLDMHQGPNGEIIVPDLTSEPILSGMTDVLPLFTRGIKNRSIGVSNVNQHSSRSHCIVRVQINGISLITSEQTQGTLFMIDLAGSERMSKGQPPSPPSSFRDAPSKQGQQVRETQSINKSLASLGDVMEALASKQAYVPYRNSKLTFLLQNALGGGAKVVMIVTATATPEAMPETLCSLSFAQRVGRIHLGEAKKNTTAPSPPRS